MGLPCSEGVRVFLGALAVLSRGLLGFQRTLSSGSGELLTYSSSKVTSSCEYSMDDWSHRTPCSEQYKDFRIVLFSVHGRPATACFIAPARWTRRGTRRLDEMGLPTCGRETEDVLHQTATQQVKKRVRRAVESSDCKVFVCVHVFTLDDEDAQYVSRTTVPRPPRYSQPARPSSLLLNTSETSSARSSSSTSSAAAMSASFITSLSSALKEVRSTYILGSRRSPM